MNLPEPIYLARVLNPEPGYIERLPLLLVVVSLLLALPGYFLLRCWVKLKREPSFLIALATMLAGGATVAWRASQYYNHDRHYFGPDEARTAVLILPRLNQQALFVSQTALLIFVSTALLIIFAVPLGIKLYRAWTGIQISPEEQSPGGIGVRAWLTPGNLIISALVAGSATGAYDYPFLGVFGLLVGCLLIQPLINTAGVPATAAPSTAAPTLTAEREKVLSLLEEGRITAEESADLLNALGSGTPRAPVEGLSPKRRMVLIGAGLVLLGFFLPWFSYNPGNELNRMSWQMQERMQGMMKNFSTNQPQGMPVMPEMNVIPGTQVDSPTVHISGGDISKGLGWLVLVLGLGTAALPYVAATMDSATRRMVSFISLAIGGIVLLWLVSQNLRFINIGLILALAGYAVEFLGLLNPRSQSTAAPAAAVERV